MGRTRTVEDEEILGAAHKAFLSRGHLATTREIADAAGISQAVLYQRFGSKDELFFAAMAPPPPNVEEILGELPSGCGETEAYLIDLADRLYCYFETVAPIFIQLGTHEAFDPPRLASAHEPVMKSGLMEALSTRFKDLAGSGLIRVPDSAAAAQLVVSVVHGEALASALLNTPTEPERRRQMVRLIWRGLAPTDTRE